MLPPSVIATNLAFAMQRINKHLQNLEAHKYNKHKTLEHNQILVGISM